MPKKKIKPFAEHDLRVTLQCAGKKKTPFAAQDQQQEQQNTFLEQSFVFDTLKLCII